MKRALDTTGIDGNGDETKKVKFPCIVPRQCKPIPHLDLYLKNHKEKYLFSELYDFEQLIQASKNINLDMVSRKQDNVDELIKLGVDSCEEKILSFSPLLATYGRDLVRQQNKITKANKGRSLKNEEDPEYSNESIIKKLAKESNSHISEADLTRRFRPVDYTAPFVMNTSGVCKEVGADRGLKLPDQLEDETSVTLKMLKDNPEGHGLDKKDLDGFSDKSKIVSVQLQIRGKKKRVRGFKAGGSILIPCTEKNCTHTALDYNNVSICSKKAIMDKKQLETQSCEGGSKGRGRGWDIDISNGEVVICEPTIEADDDDDRTTVEIVELDSPQITGVQSLAPHFNTTNLTPLASQLPNPIKKGRPPRSAANRITTQQLLARQAMQAALMSPTPSRPGILSKTAGQTIQNGATNIQAMPIILLPTNNSNKRKSNPSAIPGSTAACSFIPISTSPKSPLGSQGAVTASKLQKNLQAQALKLGPKFGNLSASTLVNKYPVTFEVEDSGALQIDNVYSTVDHSPLSANVTPKAKDIVTVTTVTESEEPVTTPEKNDEEGKPTSDEVDEEDDPATPGSKSIPFNIATNIFEDNDEERDNEEEEEFNPQIVSTSGGVMQPQQPMAQAIEIFVPPVDEDRAKQLKIKQIRLRIATAKLTEKAEYPLLKSRGDAKFMVCRICNKHIPLNCLKMYRVHLRTRHKIKLVPFAGTLEELSPTGRAGRVTELPPLEQRLNRQQPTAITDSSSSPSPIVEELFKCQTCDQLLKEKDTEEHLATCCPDMTLDIAFDRIDFGGTGTKSTEVPLLCGLCDTMSESRTALRQHLVSSHKEISHKILLDPNMRCASCLAKFDDSVHLTLHAQLCVNRRASEKTMLELARGMLYCEICARDHDGIQVTQDCYTKATIIRCVICLHVVISRGNFFHHMKTYHFRNTVGIACPFCDLGETPIRDCFVHVLESHYTPILQYKGSDPGSTVVQSEEQVRAFQKKLSDANKSRLANRAAAVTMPALRPAQPHLTTPGPSNILRFPAGAGPQIVSLRTISPLQYGSRATLTPGGMGQRQTTIAIRPGQMVGGMGSGLVTTTQGGRIIRQVHVGAGNQAVIRPIQLANMASATFRQIRPMSPTTLAGTTGIVQYPGSPLRTIRPISPTASALVTNANESPLRQFRLVSSPTGVPTIGSPLRPIRPMPSTSSPTTTGIVTSPAGTPTISVVRTYASPVRHVRAGMPIVQPGQGPNATVGGTIQAITPAQLQMRPGTVIQGRVGPVPPGTVRVNFTRASTMNLLRK